MQSFIEKAKKVIKRKQDLIMVFEELDRTGFYKKPFYKKRVNFTIDEDLFNRFRSYCKKNKLSMSSLVESYIQKWLKSKKNLN